MRDKERWMELCEQAAVEQDTTKLLELVAEINALMKEKEDRLRGASPNPPRVKTEPPD